jgi:hypothetical protein
MPQGSLFDITIGGSAATSYIDVNRAVEIINNYASNEGLAAFDAAFPDLMDPTTEATIKRNLIKCTSVVDRSYRWLGTRSTDEQSLEWPRTDVPLWGIGYNTPPELQDDIIPLEIEIGVALLLVSFQTSDRTADLPLTELKSVTLTGVAQVVWRDESTTSSLTITSEAHDYLRKYGVLIPGLNSNLNTRTLGIINMPRGD